MAKRKVKLWGASRRGHATIEDHATIGAKVGSNLKWPDGTIVKESEIRASTSTSTSTTLSQTLWRLIREIPANIVSIAALTTLGFATRISAAGAWATREITGVFGRITVKYSDGIGESGLFLLPDGTSYLLLPDGTSRLLFDEGNPIIDLGPWPTVQNSLGLNETLHIVIGDQLIVWQSFTNNGTLILDGELVIL